ncbi:MAG TPA: bifunctional serine/threonine-protein kinase/formylglycine-generating enzyme family protein [Xanthomonadaceae bacterium]|jgi:serine/threonine protein kinase
MLTATHEGHGTPTDLMQPPANPSDPRATVVHTTGDTAALPSIPGYRVIKKLGQGGMATVYMATQVALDRPVSIKVMERDALADETSMQRFENEARTIARLSHPNIVAIHEIGRTDDGRMYYSMPFLPNGDLAQRNLDQDDGRIIEVLYTLLSALDYAHERGIVHRDVKLENVLFDADNRPLLADFGIAMSKHDDVRITTAGFAVGSSAYMAPEQARGDVVDGRADLYSVGVLTYELLTGQLPFRSTDAFALALMHAQKDIPRLPPAKKHWQAFVDKAMAKEPAQRFANAKEMIDALERIAHRSGKQISRHVLRTIAPGDNGSGVKRVGLIGLASAVVLAGGLYAMRDRLPGFGNAATTPAPSTSIASPASPASSATTIPVASPAASNASTTTAMPTNTTASPATASLPAAPIPTPASPTPTTAAAGVALGNARSELDRGNLILPADRNAVDLTLAAWELAPGTADSKTLVNDVLKALATKEAMAIAAGNDQRAEEFDKKAVVLDSATIGVSAPAWKASRTAASNALQARARGEAADPAGLARTQALAGKLGVQLASTTASTAPASPLPVSPTSQGPSIASTGIDPGFVKLHGPIGIYPAAAIATAEVTRRDYASFASATHRTATACSPDERNAAQQNQQGGWNQRQGRYGGGRGGRGGRFGWNRQPESAPAPAYPGLNWNDPGYPQSSDHPVVCVSWNDAHAYADWLGQRTGHRYRLPSSAEWRLAITSGVGSASAGGGTVAARSGSPNGLGLYGLDGNVTEWLGDCAFGCERHQVAGRSWRNRGNDQIPGGRLADHAFDDVGFRLVEVLDDTHPAGQAR